jgi:hypothetical protein
MEAGSMRRYGSWLGGFTLGMASFACVEALWFGLHGVTVNVTRYELQHDVAPVVNALVKPEWPSLRRQLAYDMKPLIDEQIDQLMAKIRVSVDGVSFSIPKRAQTNLRNRLVPMINGQVDSYLDQQLTPERMVSPLFDRLTASPPVAVTVKVGSWPFLIRFVPSNSPAPHR